MKYGVWMLGLVWMLGVGVSSFAAAPTFQSLMAPEVFPEPQRGMVVETASAADDSLEIVTTGAECSLDAEGRFTFRQRIGHVRPVVSLRVEGGVKGAPELTHNGPGLAFARFASPRFDLRANGDSLFMFHAHEPLTIEIERAIAPGFVADYEGNTLFLDEWGGFGIFCSDKGLEKAMTPYAPVVARYTLPADAVLWIGICPPKAYDWERSFEDHVVWHWSRQTGYPEDADLVRWAKEGNIVLLQAEVMLWKDWNLAFEPRQGADEFARVRKTVHDNGMRFIVYTSPAYFFKGTPYEKHALNSFEGFTGWPPARGVGDNIDLFMAEITKVMTEYKPDGLYFDGQYFNNPAALYALARRTRALLGEEGILEWHSTTALGPGRCFLPQADAYVDFLLRGEGRDNSYADLDYLRYFVSCYNTSNSIGVICNNHGPPNSALISQLLDTNCRMHTIASWLDDPAVVKRVHEEYAEKLTPALQERVERVLSTRQGRIAERARQRAEEHDALEAEPQWGAPVFAESFDAMPNWPQEVSKQNETPFAAADGALSISAKAHTYAYLTAPLTGKAQGLVVKFRQGSDGGMSWGPGVCLRWQSGAMLRVGLRNDGTMQSDINGQQRLHGEHDPKQWVWLRVRWLKESGVVECSRDGKVFERISAFTHGGMFEGELAGLSLGKVPYNGESKDHSDPGGDGECQFDELAVY